jgi:putative membrane protein
MKKMRTFLSLMIALMFVTFISCTKKNEETDSTKAAMDSNKTKMDSDVRTSSNTDSTHGIVGNSDMKSDAKFAVDIADGGMREIKLSELAAKNASSAAVKNFAKMMIKDHTKAGNELKAVAGKKNITLPEKLSDKSQKSYDDLSQKKGADFDKSYMDQMVSDHNDAVSAFEKEASDGNDADLKSWAQKTLPAIKHHLDMAKSTYDNVSKEKPTAQKY